MLRDDCLFSFSLMSVYSLLLEWVHMFDIGISLLVAADI